MCPLCSASGRTAPLLCCSEPSPQTRRPWRGWGLLARPVPAPVLRDAKLHSPTTMVAAGDTQAPAPGVQLKSQYKKERCSSSPRQRQRRKKRSPRRRERFWRKFDEKIKAILPGFPPTHNEGAGETAENPVTIAL